MKTGKIVTQEVHRAGPVRTRERVSKREGRARTAKTEVQEGGIVVAFERFLSREESDRPSDLDLVAAIEAGISAKVARETAEELDLPVSVMEGIISRRTLNRRLQAAEPLTVEESDRLVRLMQITARAVEVFGDQEKALRWMKAPNRAMQGRTPLSLINTHPGVELVRDILGRIEHGVFS